MSPINIAKISESNPSAASVTGQVTYKSIDASGLNIAYRGPLLIPVTPGATRRGQIGLNAKPADCPRTVEEIGCPGHRIYRFAYARGLTFARRTRV
jgi:hypothetical protein